MIYEPYLKKNIQPRIMVTTTNLVPTVSTPTMGTNNTLMKYTFCIIFNVPHLLPVRNSEKHGLSAAISTRSIWNLDIQFNIYKLWFYSACLKLKYSAVDPSSVKLLFAPITAVRVLRVKYVYTNACANMVYILHLILFFMYFFKVDDRI